MTKGVLLNRKLFLFFLFLILFSSLLFSADSQIEFVAQITAVDTSGEFTVLTVAITPDVSLQVLVSDRTEIDDDDSSGGGDPALEVGQTVRIKGIFTELGILAQEIEIASDNSSFELKGAIQSIGDQQIEVLGLHISVPPEAEISDANGPLSFAELAVDQFVEVKGMVVDGQLVAGEVRVGRERDHFSPIRFEGLVLEFPSPELMVVGLPGDVQVNVVLTPDTDIKGNLAVGVRVRVLGQIGPDLAVVARKVIVLRLLQLVPAKVKMEPNSERRMVALLGLAFDRDIPIALSSENPDVAAPESDMVVVPAGHFQAVFQIMSGPDEGRTEIVAQLPEDLGALQARSEVDVKIDDGEHEGEQGIRWSPDKIRAAPQGEVTVRLHLGQPPAADLEVPIEQIAGDEDFVVFPETVMFPAGERTVQVPLQFLLPRGEAKLEAKLPEDAGGDSDILDINIKGNNDIKLRLQWRPREVEAGPDTDVQVLLVLDDPAPADFRAVLSLKQGDSDLLVGLPSEVEFLEGEQQAVVEFKTGAGVGKVRIRAAIPRDLGGFHDDLLVDIKEED